MLSAITLLAPLERSRPCRTLHHLDTAFSTFLTQIQQGGLLIACRDDPGCWRVVQGMIASGMLHSWKEMFSSSQNQQATCKWVITYGCAADSDVHVTSTVRRDQQVAAGKCYKLTWEGFSAHHIAAKLQADFQMQLVGNHNLMNATAALIATSVCEVMQNSQSLTAAQALSLGGASTHVLAKRV